MLKKLALLSAVLAMSVAVGFPLLASSTASTVAAAFNQTAPGPGPVLTISGTDTCEVMIAGPGTGVSVTAQVSTDGATWTPVTTIGNGSITAPGTYVGKIATSWTSFRIYVNNAGPTGVVGSEVCATGQPIPVYSPVGVVSGFGNLVCSGAVSCSPSAGPTPAVVGATPSPTASTGIGVSGSWPYTLASTAVVGEAQCTLSALTCTATATVPAGSTCLAVYDGTDTTETFSLLLPL